MTKSAFKDAVKFTKSHYENFPVLSLFIPKQLRKYIAVIYQFARQADDIVDEGNFPVSDRLTNLEEYQTHLNEAMVQKYHSNFWHALFLTIKNNNLHPDHFYNLLTAFKQDLTKKRYENYSELLSYCSNSANPVGRIILELYGIYDENANEYSDAICTGLQLTNFYQDVKSDFDKRDRIYLPGDEMLEFNVDEEVFYKNDSEENLRNLLRYQVDRARKLFDKGKLLYGKLPTGLRLQIQMTVNGGERILSKIEDNRYEVLNSRPILSKFDYIGIILKSFSYKNRTSKENIERK